ncbi:MAG: DNA topoisomerase I [Candidatus Pacearchaeota archaeon]
MPEKKACLIITEKPQAAEKIAFALSDGKDRKIKEKSGVSYFEFEKNGEKFFVGCAAGHLFGLKQKNGKGEFPSFDIEWVPSYETKEASFTKKFYDLLKKLIKNSDEFIVATDYDVEGEVIGWNVLRFLGKKDLDKQAKRMKFSSLTKEELKKSFENLLPTINWGEAVAGETRHYLDWFYGINLSRGLMKAISETGKFQILSIGRVQGPALKIIYDKELEIRNFKPEPYWHVFIKVKDGKNQYLELLYEKVIREEKELSKFNLLKGQKGIAKTEFKEEKISPPLPFDLTTLQTECYKNFGLTPSQTLRIAQNLYLEGLISYPRTSSQKFPNINLKEILEKLKSYTDLVKFAVREKPTEGKKTDPAHPAIYPTGELKKLEGKERQVYDLIVRRFISCFSEDASVLKKKVSVSVLNFVFLTNGVEFKKKGWMYVYPSSVKEKEIPTIEGEVDIKEIRIEQKQTQPPNRYNPSSLVKELEKRNLGTKATRAAIIETLYDRGYIKGNQIEITPLGIKVVESLLHVSPIILDEKLTREFEKEMENISKKKKSWFDSQKKVIEKAKENIIQITNLMKENFKKIGEELLEARNEIIKKENEEKNLTLCPVCKKGNLRISFNKNAKRFFISCSNYPECKTTFSLPPNSLIKPSKNEQGEMEMCPDCKDFPLMLSLKKGKRPWKFCFNPACPGKKV